MVVNKLLTSVKELRQHLHVHTVSAGLVAAIFGCTGPALIIIGGATSGGLTYVETISWIFAVYFFSGLLGMFLSFKYRQPIAGAHSIAGAVLVPSFSGSAWIVPSLIALSILCCPSNK